MRNAISSSASIVDVTKELTAKVSVSQTASEKWRASITLYAPPDKRQRRENKHGLGSPLGPPVKSRSYETREAALQAVEDTIVSNSALRQQLARLYDERFADSNVSVKLFLLRYWDEITSQSSCSVNVLKRYFINPDTSVNLLCCHPINGCAENSFHCLAQNLMQDGMSDDEVIGVLRYLKFIFRVAVDKELYAKNPVMDALSTYTEHQSLMGELRKALVLRSMSRNENVRLLQILRRHMETEPGLAIGCMIRWLTGMYAREVAPLVWDDIKIYDSVNVMGILVYKEFPSRETKVREMTYDDLYRIVPLCLLLREALEEYREKLRAKMGNMSEQAFGRIPVVALATNPTQHITPEQLTKFCNQIRAELGMPERLIKVSNKKGEQHIIDLSHSQGDWLRTNFDYQARQVVAVLDDINYTLGRQLRTTIARHYRDYSKPERLLAFSIAIDRWTETLREENMRIDSVPYRVQIDREDTNISFRRLSVPTMHEIRIRVPKGSSKEVLQAKIKFRFGGSIMAHSTWSAVEVVNDKEGTEDTV